MARLDTHELHDLFSFAQQLLQNAGKEITTANLVEQLSVEGMADQPLSYDMHLKITRFRHLNQKTRLVKARKYVSNIKLHFNILSLPVKLP